MSALFASEGGWQDFTLKGGEWLILWLSGGSAVLALLVGWYLMVKVLQEDEGTDKMKEIAAAIQAGAAAYLARQYKTILMVGIVLAVLIALFLDGKGFVYHFPSSWLIFRPSLADKKAA